MLYDREVSVDVLKRFVGSVVVASTDKRKHGTTVSSVVHRRLQQQTINNTSNERIAPSLQRRWAGKAVCY